MSVPTMIHKHSDARPVMTSCQTGRVVERRSRFMRVSPLLDRLPPAAGVGQADGALDGATALDNEPVAARAEGVGEQVQGLELLAGQGPVRAADVHLGRLALAALRVERGAGTARDGLVVRADACLAEVERGGVAVVAAERAVRALKGYAVAGRGVAGVAVRAGLRDVLADPELTALRGARVAVVAVRRAAAGRGDALGVHADRADAAGRGEVRTGAVHAGVHRAGVPVVATAGALRGGVQADVGLARTVVLRDAEIGGRLVRISAVAELVDALTTTVRVAGVDRAGVVVGALGVARALELAGARHANVRLWADHCDVHTLACVADVVGAGVVVGAVTTRGGVTAVAVLRVAGVLRAVVAVVAGLRDVQRLPAQRVAGIHGAGVAVVEVVTGLFDLHADPELIQHEAGLAVDRLVDALGVHTRVDRVLLPVVAVGRDLALELLRRGLAHVRHGRPGRLLGRAELHRLLASARREQHHRERKNELGLHRHLLFAFALLPVLAHEEIPVHLNGPRERGCHGLREDTDNFNLKFLIYNF